MLGLNVRQIYSSVARPTKLPQAINPVKTSHWKNALVNRNALHLLPVVQQRMIHPSTKSYISGAANTGWNVGQAVDNLAAW